MKISVITAAYNARATIGDALDSIFEQDYADVEHIVIDGASTDGTMDVINRYRNRIEVLVSEGDSGIYDALNKGIRMSTADVVGFLHADDMFAWSGTLSAVAAAFDDADVGAVYGDLVYVKQEDTAQVVRYWHSGEYSRTRILQGWMPPHPTFYVRRELYEKMGLFDTRFRIAADYENILRILACNNVKAAYIPRVMVKMRVGGTSNRSLRNVIAKSGEDYLAMRLNGIGGIQTLFMKNVRKLPQFFLRQS